MISLRRRSGVMQRRLSGLERVPRRRDFAPN